MLIAHLGPSHVDIPLCLALIAAIVIHARGRRGGMRRWRERAFVAGVATLAVALASPLDGLSSSRASAHMIQHLLLTVVAAPLLVVSAPIPALLRGLPRSLRRAVRGVRLPAPRRAVPWAILHVIVLWSWHAAALYEAALRNDLLHRLEHVSFLVTALLVWAAVLSRRAAGIGVLVLFGLSVQSGLLGALMTFAPTPWYPTYSLADQQLAGVIMWVPGGGSYLVAALALLMSLVAASDRSPPGRPRDGAARRTARDRRSADHGHRRTPADQDRSPADSPR